MHLYKNANNSGISFYEIGKGFIKLQFTDGKQYLYNYDKPGKKHVEKMKSLAKQGNGLATYINQYIKENYFERLK